MTTILLICSVALNILLFVWALVIWRRLEFWKNQTLHLDHLLCALSPMNPRDFATSESASTPSTSTESPTPANDADDYGSR